MSTMLWLVTSTDAERSKRQRHNMVSVYSIIIHYFFYLYM